MPGNYLSPLPPPPGEIDLMQLAQAQNLDVNQLAAQLAQNVPQLPTVTATDQLLEQPVNSSPMPRGSTGFQDILSQIGGNYSNAHHLEQQNRATLIGTMNRLLEAQKRFQSPSAVNYPLMAMAAQMAGNADPATRLAKMLDAYGSTAMKVDNQDYSRFNDSMKNEMDIAKLGHDFFRQDTEDSISAMKMLADIEQANALMGLKALTVQDAIKPKLSPRAEKSLDESQVQMENIDASLEGLNKALSLNPKIPGGPRVPAEMALKEWTAPNDPSLVKYTQYQNLILSQVATSLKATFGGNPTEGERKFLKEIQAIGSKTPAQREALLKTGIDILNNRRERLVKRQEKIRGGFFTPGYQDTPVSDSADALDNEDIPEEVQGLLSGSTSADDFDMTYGEGAAAAILEQFKDQIDAGDFNGF